MVLLCFHIGFMTVLWRFYAVLWKTQAVCTFLQGPAHREAKRPEGGPRPLPGPRRNAPTAKDFRETVRRQ